MRLDRSRRFSADKLNDLDKIGPWLKLHFYVPRGRLSKHLASATVWRKLAIRVAARIRKVLEKEGRYLGFIVLPEHRPTKGLDDFCLTVYVSQIWFTGKESPLARKWRRLPDEQRSDLLAAFYRPPVLKIGNDELEALRLKWRKALKWTGTNHKQLVRCVKAPKPLAECFDDYKDAIGKWVSKQLKGLRLRANGRSTEVRLADGTVANARDYLAVGRILHGWFSPGAPRRFGFFSNKDVGFSFVAREAIRQDRHPKVLRKRSGKAFGQLCDVLEVDPDDYPME